MNLRDVANESLANFDPKKDNPNNTNDGLPEGQYDIVVDQAGHRVYDSGFSAVAINAEVVQGEHTGRKELINIALEADYLQKYPNLLKQNIQLISKLAYVTGTELTDEDWESEETVGQAFRGIVGEQFILHVSKNTSKKSGKTFTNYDFEPYGDTIDVEDDDGVPF